MRGLDDTDREILRILLSDGRRSYSDIAEAVDLSPPAVSDRVERLQDLGVIRRFTVDVDRAMLREGVPLLLALDLKPGTGPGVAADLRAADAVEHVFRTADDRLVATATVPQGEVPDLLTRTIDEDSLRDYDVRLLAETSWEPALGEAELAPTCAECGNSVDAEGESETLGGEVYHFCCGSCRDNFVEQYESLREGAEG